MTSAVIVGSGPNGLAAGLTLAAEGVEVTVLEAADTLGGGTRSSELTLPGLIHDECSAAHPLALDTPFSRRFDLAAPRADVPLAGGAVRTPARRRLRRRGVPLGRADRRGAGVATAGAGRRCSARWPSASTTIAEDFLRPMLHVPAHPLALARFGAVSGLPAAVLARLFSTPEARALFAGVAAHAFRPFRSPMSVGDRRHPRNGCAPLRLAGRRGRLGGDQRRDDLAARGLRRDVRDRRARLLARRSSGRRTS